MTALLLAAAALGVAGFDPVGALVLAAAAARGASRGALVGFALALVLATAGLGVALSLTVGARVAAVRASDLLPGPLVGSGVELVLALVLGVWAWRRARSGPRPPTARRGRTRLGALVGVALLLAPSTLGDPAYLAVIVLAGRDAAAGGPAAVVAAHVVWTLVAQAPMVVLAAAVLLGAHEATVGRFTAWWERTSVRLRPVLTVAIAVTAVALAADAVLYATTGSPVLTR